MEPGTEAVMQENVVNSAPPLQPPPQPPVQGLQQSLNPAPAVKDVIPRSVYHTHTARHRKSVATKMCEICNIELIGQVVIDAHMKGSKHAKKLKARELLSHLIFKCEFCNVSLNSTQQIEVHNAGAKHIAKVKESSDTQAQALDGAAAQANVPNADGSSEAQASGVPADKAVITTTDLSCTVCNIKVNSPQQLEQHLGSKKHKDRESGRSQRPAPYQRAGHSGRGGRGGRGGLGSHGGGQAPPARGAKGPSGKYSSLSTSFKSAGYSNSFIKPEGGVILPSNCGTNKGPGEVNPHAPPHGNRVYNSGAQFKNRGNFGSLTPYISTDTARGGFDAHGSAGASVSHTSWPSAPAMYGGYPYDYGYAGYNYSGYENTEGYTDYGMMQPEQPGLPPGPPPSY